MDARPRGARERRGRSRGRRKEKKEGKNDGKFRNGGEREEKGGMTKRMHP